MLCVNVKRDGRNGTTSSAFLCPISFEDWMGVIEFASALVFHTHVRGYFHIAKLHKSKRWAFFATSSMRPTFRTSAV